MGKETEMADQEEHFIRQINEHLGIAHKVCRIYFDDPDDRKDALQEMMFQLWRSHSKFAGHSKFSTWMYSVCLNTALTYRKKNTKVPKVPLKLHHHQIAEPHADPVETNIALLFEAIGTLTSLNKAIVLLYLEEMSYEEIASVTGLTRSNVSVRLVRIKKELESELKKKLNTSEYGNP